MPKLTNVRERVHQPFRDTLCRFSGWLTGTLGDQTDLFTVAGKPAGETNLPNGSTLPSDQSMVVLALRVFTWFRNPIQRGANNIVFPDATTALDFNGDFHYPVAGGAVTGAQFGAMLNGNAVGDIHDVYRLHWQAEEQLLWSVGAGDKYSMTSMPTAYFAYGGALWGDLGGSTDLIHFQNGVASHEAILRMARALLIPPRQNIKCSASIQGMTAGNNAAVAVTTQGTRDMLSLRSNLNAPDGIGKVVSMTLDGLFSRDVQ